MNKLTKLKLAGLLALILLLGGLSVAKARSGFSWGNVERLVAQLMADKVDTPVQEETLGAVTGPDLPNPNCTNGLCTYVASGSFADATTSIVSIIDPFRVASSTATGTNSGVIIAKDGSGNSLVDWLGNTSTVDKMWLHFTGPATSSFKVACGAAAKVSAAPAVFIIPSSTLVATHTTNFVLENFVTSTTGTDILLTSKIFLTPANPYLNCVVDATMDSVGNDNESITQVGNAFDGSYKVRISR